MGTRKTSKSKRPTRARNQPRSGAVESKSRTTGTIAQADRVGKVSPLPAYLGLTEATAKKALVESRGDIFVASQLLSVTAVRLNRAIQVSAILQATVDAIQKLTKGASEAAIEEAIQSRVSLYRVAGLDALHDLATMKIDANSAQNQVKLAAAARLAGSVEQGGGNALEETLRELNKSYQEQAPRLRMIRERVTVEVLPQERVVSEQGQQD